MVSRALPKLKKGFKTVDTIVPMARQFMPSILCSCCMFLWGDNCVSWRWKAFTTSTIECKKSLQTLSPQRSYQVKSYNWKTILHLCTLRLVSIKRVCYVIIDNIGSGEPSRISWAYYWNVVRTNAIAIFLVRGVVWAWDYCIWSL